jgi:uncharacterized membrane protein (DUF485 family)
MSVMGADGSDAGRAARRANHAALRELGRQRWRVAIVLSACVFVLYFGFLGLAAFAKDAMATQLVPGLSVGIVLGALVIFGSWGTTFVYAHWANGHFDRTRKSLDQRPTA